MITTYEQLPQIRHEAGETEVFLKGGTFDLLHQGHIQLLKNIRGLGGVSVVGISPDKRVVQRKGPSRPVNSQELRLHDIEDTGLIDFVFLVPEGRLGLPKSLGRLKPNTFVERKGDSRFPLFQKPFLNLLGIRYLELDQPRITSTTDILKEGAHNFSAGESGIVA